jgi:putative isomerase
MELRTPPFPDPALLAKKQAEYFSTLLALLPKGVRHAPPHPPYFTGYSHETLYDWDQYFEAILLGYCGYPMDYPRNGIKLFLSLQEEDGYVPRSFHPARGVYYKHNVIFKPFLTQMALFIVGREGGRAGWLAEEIFGRLKRFYFCWRRRYDVRGAGLSVWEEAEHTGMDNHYDRAGSWLGERRFCEGVDLNCYLVREGEALASLADLLGRAEDATEIRADLAELRAAIQKWLWNEELGMFLDYHATQDRPIPVKYVGTFAPLWAGAATPEQARRLVEEHLTNPREFWRPFPLPALAASEPGYSEGYIPGESTGCCTWRANTWMPTNYMTFHGLRAYGYTDLAAELAQRSFTLFERGRFCEYYTAESGIGTGLRPFWGWSALAIFMPTEMALGVDPTSGDGVERMREHFARL